MNPLCLLSATELAARIRAGEASSVEVVEAHVQRIRRVNPRLNAMVRDRFDEARAEARRADAALADGPVEALGPLHGVPCSIKEVFAMRGMPQTAGLVARRDVVATHDATAVARLRRAGAIPLGSTNISELCMWMESHNKVYGRTNNPYDPTRIVGGSSGGEGAIVAAGGAPFGLGSDIGGSIRLPAFFNGVFGHKPTGGLVPNSGQFPLGHGRALRYHTTGPLARRVEDLMPLLRILSGPDGQDSGCRPLPLGDPDAVDLASLEVLSVPDNGRIRVSRELTEAQERCARALERAGATVRRGRIPGLRRSFDYWSSMLGTAGGPSFGELLGEGRRIEAGRELLRFIAGRSPHTFPALALAVLERINDVAPARTRRLFADGLAFRDELVGRIGPRGVMLYPPYPVVAPRHREPLLRPLSWVYTAVMNVMELPVTQVPLGLDRRGLPLGVQVVGVHGNDHVTIAVAQALEKAFGGWVPPRG